MGLEKRLVTGKCCNSFFPSVIFTGLTFFIETKKNYTSTCSFFTDVCIGVAHWLFLANKAACSEQPRLFNFLREWLSNYYLATIWQDDTALCWKAGCNPQKNVTEAEIDNKEIRNPISVSIQVNDFLISPVTAYRSFDSFDAKKMHRSILFQQR